jgi:uncharacterized protein YjiS (DUF1127 family)
MAFISISARPAISERIQSLFDGFREARARRAVYSRTVRELSLLNDRDLADLGISRLSIRDIAYKHAYKA